MVELFALPLLAAGSRLPRFRTAAPGPAIAWHRWRLCRLLGVTERHPDRRPWAYLWARLPVGVLAAVVTVLTATGAVTAIGAVAIWITGGEPDGIPPDPFNVVYLTALSAVLAFLAHQGMAGIAEWERRLAARLLGVDREELLRRRVVELADSRAAVMAAVDDERRRIERDLHDGVQQRLVALGMLIGRARRAEDPQRGTELLAGAQQEVQAALAELRETAWRVYPAALDSGGLAGALEELRDRSALPVDLTVRLTGPPPPTVATVGYFVVSEAVTNAAKHSGAERVTATVTGDDDRLSVTVVDHGVGGADPAGRGLSGLARRVAAVDGHCRVDSPPGGPTTITVELPCA